MTKGLKATGPGHLLLTLGSFWVLPQVLAGIAGLPHRISVL